MKKIIVLVLILFAVSSCEQSELNKYELKNVDNKIIRLNKKTGEMIVIDGTEITKIDDQFIQKNLLEKYSIYKPRYFNKRAFPESKGLMKADLALKWRDNKIFYRYTIYPYNEKVYESFGSDSITIQFTDIDGFTVKSVTVSLNSLSRIVNDEGIPNAWSYEGSFSCNKELFQQMKEVSPQWRFSKELKLAIHNYSKILKKEMKSLNNKLVSSIKNAEIYGIIKDDGNYSIKNKYGTDIEVLKDDTTYIKYILEHKEEFKYVQVDKESISESSSSVKGMSDEELCTSVGLKYNRETKECK